MSRKEEGSGLASIEDSVDASIRLLKNFIKKSKRFTASRNNRNKTRINRLIAINKNGKKNNCVYISRKTMRNLACETS